MQRNKSSVSRRCQRWKCGAARNKKCFSTWSAASIEI